MGTCPYRQVYKTQTYFYRKLVCPTSRIAGRTICLPRMVAEPQLLEFVIGTLRSQVIDDGFEERLRNKLHVDLGVGFERNKAALIQLHDEIERYERMIDRATENLLLVPLSQVRRAVAKLSSWQVKQDAAATRLRRIEAGKPRNIDKLVSETMSVVRRLQFGLIDQDHNLLHHTLQQLVSRVTLWFEPHKTKRGCQMLAKGLLVVREPSYDSVSIERTIEFTRFDLISHRPRLRFGWRRMPENEPVAVGHKSHAQRCSAPEICAVPSNQSRQMAIPAHLG